MKHKITSTILLMVPFLLFGQMINNFDADPEADYWGYEISENADSTLSFINVSYVTDPVSEGAGAMQLDYSAHNIEAWGGYAKIFHMLGGGDDEPGSPVEGTWMMAPVAGALMVGPAPNDGSWWSSSEEDVTTRACYFDDEYVFGADGSFQNVLDEETWIEGWQGGSDACGAPVYPHDGSNAATWDYNTGTGTVTLSGVGAYLGLPKAWNGGELASPDEAPESITYDISLSGSDMTLVIEAGAGVFWTFQLVEVGGTGSPLEGAWKMAPVAGALMVGPAPNDGSWWSSSEEDVTTRACYFDDEYIFNSDGSFNNVLDGETWIEGWQGGSDACGAPVYPHDGSNAATWDYNAGTGTVTLNGVGAYLGLAKAWNGGELASPDEAPESITYDITLSGSDMTLVIEAGAGVFWTFKLVLDGPEPPLSGIWMMAPEAGALMVGPAPNDGSWWSSSEEDVTTRACYFDDEYIFNSDGSFNNVLDGETWIEGWQGGSDACGAPVYPHDGSNAATWDYNAGTGTVTLNGVGAYLGLAKAWNGGELASPDEAPESITYDATLSGNTMTLVIEAGAGVFWTFKLVEAGSALVQADDWMTILDTQPRDGEVWDWSGYDSISFSYYNSVPQSLEGRVHLRLNLSDYGDVADPANYTGLGEYYYSFLYILDNASGWNTITMPLERNDSWDGGGFNLTGWAGDAGNGVLDIDAIAGFHLEFSISGGGDGDYSNGTIVLDDFKLTGSQNALTNPGFELAEDVGDDIGWGWTHAGEGQAHTEIVTDASNAHSGDNYARIGTDNGTAWAVFYSEDIVPAQFGETWNFSGYAKSLSAVDGDFGAFKLEGKDADGNVLGTTGDVFLPITEEWGSHSIEIVMPEGVTQVTAVMVASRWDGSNCDYAFDDMFLMSMGVLDVIPPDPVQNVGAVPASYYNLVTWSDNDGEEGETYNVYASTEPITDISSPTVDVVVTNVLEGSQAAVHYLFNPLEDADATYYYAVACKDASNNVGEPGLSDGSITNTAKGIPTISLDPPADFIADGDFSEWYDSGIAPFVLGTTDNSWGTPSIVGSVTDDDDLSGQIWLAVDEDYLYIAADVIDDVYDGYQAGDGTGGWWENDVLELFIGLYDQRGPKHVGMQRGDEPDYKFFFLETHAVNDFNSQDTLAVNGDGNYYQEGFNPDWVVEAKLALDDIAFGDDIRLNALNGMRIPIEPTFHDNDGAGWEGNLVGSPLNTDNAWQTPSVWSSTWIGDQSTVGIDGDDGVIANEFALFNNYPNPFNPVTTIKFSIPETQQVTLKVYNLMGREVVTLIDQELQAGYHTTKWHASNMASGIYFYKLMSEKKAITQKMLLLK